VVGYDGKRVLAIQRKTGTKISVNSATGSLRILANDPRKADAARLIIENYVEGKVEKARDKSDDLLGDWPTTEITIPAALAPGFIGGNGAHIRTLKRLTGGVRFKVNTATTNNNRGRGSRNGNDNTTTITVRAPTEQLLETGIAKAEEFIAKLEADYLSNPEDSSQVKQQRQPPPRAGLHAAVPDGRLPGAPEDDALSYTIEAAPPASSVGAAGSLKLGMAFELHPGDLNTLLGPGGTSMRQLQQECGGVRFAINKPKNLVTVQSNSVADLAAAQGALELFMAKGGMRFASKQPLD